MQVGSNLHDLPLIGEKEVSENTLSIRRKFKGDLGSLKLDDFVSNIKKEISGRLL